MDAANAIYHENPLLPTYTDGTDPCTLSLKVTRLLRDTIFHMFKHSGWDFNEVTNPTADDARNNRDDEEDFPPFVIQQDNEAVECTHCLCKPCITSECNIQLWWETENNAPVVNNNNFGNQFITDFGQCSITDRFGKICGIWKRKRKHFKDKGDKISE
jgi:hypothetical protein